MSTILLYYKYVAIDNPEAIRQWQFDLCTNLGLTGRILIAHEGINGTVGGADEACKAYIDAMNAHPLFGNIDFKTSPGGAEDFPRLRVAVRPEIVSLGVDPENLTVRDSGQHLTPAQAHKLLEEHPADLVILDARNNYESRVGTFKGAITPDIEMFRELPAYIDGHLEQFADKQVLMFCTGGVRCERATAYLNRKNIAKNVYQIEGGIHRYAEQFPDGYFRGKNYVFDGRIAAHVTDDVLAQCDWCKTSCDEYANCVNTQCNKQIILCPACTSQSHVTCSERCRDLVMNKKVKIRTKQTRTLSLS